MDLFREAAEQLLGEGASPADVVARALAKITGCGAMKVRPPWPMFLSRGIA